MNNSSKLLLIIFCLVIFSLLFFFIGRQYQKSLVSIEPIPSSSIGTSAPTSTTEIEYYSNPTEWQVDQDREAEFSIAYPIDFDVDDNNTITPTTDWRLNSNNISGIKDFTLTIPKAFEPQTNFSDATLTIGRSQNPTAVSQCLTPDPSEVANGTTSTQTINNIPFTMFTSTDAAAGNYYETTSYRTVHAGQCYAIEYTLHSSQIMNYPSSYNLQPFDENKPTTLLKNIIGTFMFL